MSSDLLLLSLLCLCCFELNHELFLFSISPMKLATGRILASIAMDIGVILCTQLGDSHEKKLPSANIHSESVLHNLQMSFTLHSVQILALSFGHSRISGW